MSRFETKFAELAAKKEGAFVPFVTFMRSNILIALLRLFAR